MMCDRHAQARVQLEQEKAFGNDAEKEDAHPEARVPAPPVSPEPPGVTTAGNDAANISNHTRKNRPKQRKDEKDSCGNLDKPFYASEVSDHAAKNLSNLTGGVKTQKGKSETNGNYVQGPRNPQEACSEEAVKPAKKRRPVTVDSAKAKTSLEALKLSIKQLKWKEFPLGRRAACDIYWHGVSFHDNDNVSSGQVNKFPGMIEMLRKINTSRAVRTMQELFPEEYDFYPRSWILPEEFQLFCAQAVMQMIHQGAPLIRMVKEKDATLSPTFIVKPDGGSQGDGIYLIRDPSELKATVGSQARQGVVQEYIHKPLLIDKLKFDIRLYVLMKSLEPLEIYIAKEGLTRFCTEPYQEPSQKNLSHVFMHLTNYSLNVHSGNFVHSESQSTGSKRTLSSVLYRLAAKGVDIKKVWSDIIALVIKTLIAVVPELKVYYHAEIPPGKPGPTCFQILGFDILLMKNLKPVLLEVNSNPSMRIEHEQEVAPGVFKYVPSPVDKEVKVGVIRDTLRLMDPGHKKPSIYQLRPGGLEHSEEIPMESETPERSPDEGALPSLCLKQVYPKYAKQFNHLRLVERIAGLFIRFLGVKGNMRLGPTAFRTFIRSCKLSNSNFTMAA
ncbi:Tubulin polyglutamylase TTLL11 [Takifugu flavidus]|uniref:Tubulin polyglutamylase TTLL11 n=1 Tax=Takifugu flavidus TaxID=433684 RepID=A0A5C6NGV1_9TELE|nr:Tubulin polyglutamylase TTLL11 [Takifugu flavidus]